MKKYSLALIFLFLQIGCQNQPISPVKVDSPAQIVAENSVSKLTDENINPQIPNDGDQTYPGKTIDQVFPIIERRDFREEDLKQKTYAVEADNFQVVFKKLTPQTINRNGQPILKFQTLHAEGYWANLVGISRLLGANSKQIYVVASGTGGVCCTNYWITDVSGKKPVNIFRSEDFGHFRDPMEIFDADDDGIYELVQFDSAFRYFMGDCGACSPEPRAVFKYDKKSSNYLPAKGIQQDFVRESFLETEKWILESFQSLSKEETPELKTEYARRFLDYVVDLFYLGEERKAWKTFDQYYIGYADKEEVRAEIKNRLAQSKYFQALKKTS